MNHVMFLRFLTLKNILFPPRSEVSHLLLLNIVLCYSPFWVMISVEPLPNPALHTQILHRCCWYISHL